MQRACCTLQISIMLFHGQRPRGGLICQWPLTWHIQSCPLVQKFPISREKIALYNKSMTVFLNHVNYCWSFGHELKLLLMGLNGFWYLPENNIKKHKVRWSRRLEVKVTFLYSWHDPIWNRFMSHYFFEHSKDVELSEASIRALTFPNIYRWRAPGRDTEPPAAPVHLQRRPGFDGYLPAVSEETGVFLCASKAQIPLTWGLTWRDLLRVEPPEAEVLCIIGLKTSWTKKSSSSGKTDAVEHKHYYFFNSSDASKQNVCTHRRRRVCDSSLMMSLIGFN